MDLMTRLDSVAVLPDDAAPTRQWKSSVGTRRAILDAARERFTVVGYEHTTIQDIVDSSGVSVGSIYHHIGGKSAIFVAVATEVIREQAEASHTAVAAARERGEDRAVELYFIGARAYLMESWRNRPLSRVMLGDDRPTGFAQIQQSLTARFMAGTRDLVLGEPPTAGASSRAITAILFGAARELILAETEESAEAIVEYFLSLLRNLAEHHAEGSATSTTDQS